MSATRAPTASQVLAALCVTGLLFVGLTACAPPPAAQVEVVASSATDTEPGPQLAGPDLVSLRQAALAVGGAVGYVVNTNTGQPSEISLTPRRPDGQVDHGPNRDAELAANLAQLQQLVGGQAADGPFDLLSLLAEAVRVSSVPGTLYVLTSGLSTAGGFDLQQLGWAANPATVAAELRQERLLPRLNGWHVIFSGLGDTAGDQPALPLPQQSELVGYVMAICHASGAASCATDDVTRPDPASLSTYPARIVAVPAVTPVSGPHGGHGESIPADIFFRLNSAALLPGADSYLSPLAAQAAAEHVQVSIEGFASPESGSAAYNQRLSQARADSIRARLLGLGVSPAQIVSAAGEGTAGKTAAACYRDGHLDETVCAQLRRVVILLTPASAA
jgi:outer membrane protein OmpA-like peptidoglycan-associated protein